MSWKPFTLVLCMTSVVALAGCEQRYRYACQDSTNWDKPQCQKPLCEINRDCPEHIFKNEPVKAPTPAPAPRPLGDCK